MARGTKLETLGDLRDHGMGLFAHCTAQFAGHGSVLPLDQLIETYGEDYVYINETRIGRACRCQICGHLGARLTLMADVRPEMVRNGAI